MKKPLSFVHYFFILLFLAVVFFALSSDLPRRQGGGFFSDEASYFSITQSLAYDGDIRYDRRDIIRIKERFWVGPTGFFLKKAKDGNLYYAKSFIYPLLAAPFFRLFDVRGLLLFNGLLLFLSLLMTYFLLRCHHPPGKSLSFSLVFLLASVAWIYVWWLQPDFFNYFMMLAGLFFFFYPFRKRVLFYLCGVFFALAAFSKPTNVVPVGIVMLLLLWRRQWKRLLVSGLVMAALLAGIVYFNYSQTGEWNFMGGERKSFLGKFPFERAEYGFDDSDTAVKMTFDDYQQRYHLDARTVAMDFFYFFFGRFTGLLIYFPSAVFLLALFFFQKKEPEDWFILAAIAAGILALVIAQPDNYFGGSGSLGNRYFLNLMPLFFFLGHKNRIFSSAALPLFAAVLFLPAAFLDSLYHSYTPRAIGSHFPASLFPVEKTQFNCLPSNENPRAFYRSIHQKYWLYFLNDNFHDLEGDFFWTYGGSRAEFLLVAPRRVREFRIALTNNPQANRVTVQVEDKRLRLALMPRQEVVVVVKDIHAFKASRRYVYHFRVQSQKGFTPYYADSRSQDTRLLLGVKTRIEAVY